jgi:hypothetical protein
MKNNQGVWDAFRNSNRPVIVVEVGMLRRGSTWKLGLNGTGNDAYYGKKLIPGRAAQLRLEAKPWTNAGYNIVIAAQRSDSQQWAGQPPTTAWLTETANTIRKYTDRPIVIRPHPRQRISDIPGCVIEMPRPIQGTYDSFDYDRCLSTAWAVVNHNSSPAVAAGIEGIPVFVTDPERSQARDIAGSGLNRIEKPHTPDRLAWIHRISQFHWSHDELRSGACWAHMKKWAKK